MARSYRRRDYFIKKWFQTRFVIYFLILLVTGSILLTIALYNSSIAALRLEMFKGHSSTYNTWETFRDGVFLTNIKMTIIMLALAFLLAIALSWKVGRSSRTLNRNLHSAISGSDTEQWKPIPRHRELQHLQSLLAAGLMAHRERVRGVRNNSAALLDEVKQLKEDLSLKNKEIDQSRLRELAVKFEGLKHQFKSFLLGD